MSDRIDILKNLVNSSGYAFQLAVGRELDVVRQNGGDPYAFMLREHPWRKASTQEEGFIDLVLGTGILRVVIECKRPRDGVWVFLVDHDKHTPTERVRCPWVHHSPGNKDLSGYTDFRMVPESLESDMCIVRGQDEARNTLLERIGSILITSCDCLAEEQLSLLQAQPYAEPLIFLPLLVTAAELRVCRVNISDIRLSDGTLDSMTFETVPFIRFRKSLSTELTPMAQPKSLIEASQDHERTLIVVNATYLVEYFSKWELNGMIRRFAPLPWEQVRY